MFDINLKPRFNENDQIICVTITEDKLTSKLPLPIMDKSI